MLTSTLASEAAHGSVASSPLTVAIVLPFLGALAVSLVPRGRAELHRLVALVFSAGTGAITVWLVAAFDRHDAGFQFEVHRNWIADLGIGWHLGVDGISIFLVVLSGLLFPLAIVAVAPSHNPKPYYAWLLVLQAGCIGVFCALDLFVFFVMFEIVLVPMYFLIGGWGYAERVYAALKFFIFTMLGSALMLVGIVSLAVLHHDKVETRVDAQRSEITADAKAELDVLLAQAQTIDQTAPGAEDAIAQIQARVNEIDGDAQAKIEALPSSDLTFDLPTIAEAQEVRDTSTSANPLDWSAARWIFLAFALAFAVKVPLFPLHTWLPDAHTQAPTAGSVVLAGVMLKLGTYGLLRFGLFLFPEAAWWSRYLWLGLAVIGIVYGAIVATMQADLKRLVAYSSVAHLGFIVLGTFAFTSQAISGSVLQMINHGLSTGALFLLVGMIYERRHTRQIAELHGIQTVAPIFAAAFMVVMLSSIGVPGLNGFVGEYLILTGTFLAEPWYAAIAATGVILAALYLLWAYQRVFHGEPDDANRTFPELKLGEAAVLVPIIGVIVFTGIYPKPMLERIEPAVDRLIAHVEDRSDYRQPEVTVAGTGVQSDAPADEGHGEDAGHGSATEEHE
jgi:NADH:ubiquinone oxidoreductase subunit 4 (subunit M)